MAPTDKIYFTLYSLTRKLYSFASFISATFIILHTKCYKSRTIFNKNFYAKNFLCIRYNSMNIYPFVTSKHVFNPRFTASLTYKPADTNKNLIEYEKNDFISGIYYTDIINKEQTIIAKVKINKYMNDCSLEDYSSKLFDNHNPDDAPFKFAAIVKKLDRLNKNTFINNHVPEVFKNIPEKEIIEKLDIISYSLRDNYKTFKDNDVSINIGGKSIKIKYIGKGENSIVCKLSDEFGNNAAMKTYIKPEDINSFSIFGELALYQDEKYDKINNIPALYMANPLSVKVEDKSKEISEIFDIDNLKDFDGYKGAWTLVEYITKDTPIKSDGISFQEWLKRRNLFHIDISCDNCIGKYIIDIGGVSA